MTEIEVRDEPIRYVDVRSRRFLCGACNEFLLERQMVVKAGYGGEFWRRMREKRNRALMGKRAWNSPATVVLTCPNGCHRAPWWSFRDMTMLGKTFKPQDAGRKQ